MNNEFVTNAQALELRKLGFDEPCYTRSHELFGLRLSFQFVGVDKNDIDNEWIPTPLRQQVFDWFETKHSLFVERKILVNINEIVDISYNIVSWKIKPIPVYFETQSDSFDKCNAERIVINKLIDILKTNKYERS